MKFNVINVFGFAISAEVQEAALREFLDAMVGGAKPYDVLQEALERRGVPNNRSEAFRGADRLLQKARKANVIAYSKDEGGWIAGKESLPDLPMAEEIGNCNEQEESSAPGFR